jgi:hypothetical protein
MHRQTFAPRHRQPQKHGSAAIGTECVHVAIDDHSRIVFSSVRPDQSRATAIASLREPMDWYAELGIHFKGVLTDNGGA